ncbi:MAG: HD domain-containing protein [Bilophila wadsworthia]
MTISNRNLQTASSSTTSCGRIRRRPVPASPPARKRPPAGTVLPLRGKTFPAHREAGPNCSTARGPSGCTTPPVSRELLYYAALLHDIGIFISFANHNAHSHYLIRNTELLGFTEREIELIAALAFFHRKRPSKKIPLFLQLDEGIREEVRLLSLFLTLAERMDKSHRQIIRSARFGRTPDGELDCAFVPGHPIEIEEIGRSHKLIEGLPRISRFALSRKRAPIV